METTLLPIPLLSSIADKRVTHWRDLLVELVLRDLRIRYKSSTLGFAWTVLNPLLQVLVFYFVFRYVTAAGMRNFAAFVFIGVLVYNWFQAGLGQAVYAVTGNRELITKPGFPAACLPLVAVITPLIQLLLSFPIAIPFVLLSGSRPGWSLLALPLLLAIQFVLTLGLAYLVAGANVLIRDVAQVLPVILRLFFFLTPIFYSSTQIPPHVQPYYRLNPLVSLVEGYRAVLLEGVYPDWGPLAIISLVALGVLLLGYATFVHLQRRFVEEL